MMNLTRPIGAVWMFTSTNNPTTTKSLVTAAARERRLSVKSDDFTITLKGGSRLRTMLSGARAVPPHDLPIEALLEILPAENGSIVRVAMADRLGIGFRTAVEDVFLRRFETLSDDLAGRAALTEIGQSAPRYDGLRAPGGSKARGYAVLAIVVFIAVIVGSIFDVFIQWLFAWR